MSTLTHDDAQRAWWSAHRALKASGFARSLEAQEARAWAAYVAAWDAETWAAVQGDTPDQAMDVYSTLGDVGRMEVRR